VVELLLTQKIHSISQENQLFDANERARSKGWEELTGRYTQKVISLLLDNIVYSAPEYLADQ
jgi:hypothetical protein